jgi:hypothetical protein
MTVPQDMAERHGRMLARFAELSLTLAEDVHAAAAAAPEPEQKARLAEAFHRLGRALRQSVALEAKLVRDRVRDVHAAEAEAAEGRAQAVRRRREQVRAEVERQIYCEVDLGQADTWLADFEERLETEALDERFTDEALDDQVARLAAELGLTGEARHDYTPRRCRPRVAEPGRLAASQARLRDLLGWTDEEDGEDDEEDEDEDADETEEAEEEVPDIPPPVADEVEPPPPLLPPPADPEPEPQPPPDLTPRPPDPEPYIPPWERDPHGRFPGGSGY